MKSGSLTRSQLLLAVVFLALGCGDHRQAAGEIADGKRLYQTYGCAACHGPEGHGDGPAALPSPARDFRNVAAFRGGRDVDAVAATIESGVGAMPAFSHIPEEERRNIAAYVVSLAVTKGKK